MSTLRKRFITAFAVLFCTLLAISAALLIPKNKTADAYSGPQNATVAEIYSGSDARKFDYSKLQSLYGQLAGDSTVKTLADLVTRLNVSENGISPSNSNDTIASKNVLVQYGGKTWLAVYLSKAEHSLTGAVDNITVGETAAEKALKGYADDGDVVLTLWLPYVDRNIFTLWSYNNINNTYPPSNMYGASWMRSVILANGGNYWNGTSLVSPPSDPSSNDAQQTANFGYSPFTSTGLSDYLVAPRYMQWQYQQSAKNSTHYDYNFNSDAWGNIGSGFVPGYQFENLYTGWDNLYSAWKDDLVWLPSIAEMGVRADSLDTSTDGLWGTSYAQRQCEGDDMAWTRSAVGEAGSGTYDAAYMQNGWVGNNLRTINTYGSGTIRWLLRPAIHLNLTKANEIASGVAFGPSGTTVTTENIDGTDVKIATKNGELVYNGNAFTVTLPDKDRQDVTGSGYTDTTGVFSVTTPDTSADKVHEITVTPKNGYHWEEYDDPDEKTAARRYRIKIKLANITVNWSDLSVTSGGSLLQETKPTVIGGATVESTIKVKYFIVPPDATAEPPTGDDGWIEPDEDHASDFIASQSGTYRVYYKVTANYHNPTEVAFYDVNVGSDPVKITVSGNVSIGSATYSEGNALKLTETDQAWLKGQIKPKLTFTRTSTSTPISGTELSSLWDKLEIFLFTYNSSNLKVNSAPNDNGYYDVGTYLFGVRYKSDVSAADKTHTFSWDIQSGKEIHPTFTVNKKTIKVKVIADGDGATLTHVYGETPVDMTYALVNETALDANGESIDDLGLWDNFTIKDTDGDVIDSSTPAGTYYVIGSAQDTSNYDVQFEGSEYVITKRAVTLKVTDEEVSYGTDLNGYKFKAMTVTSGSIADVDDFATLIAGAVYSLTLNGVDVDLSDNVYIGVYDLHAVIESDNYDFTVESGKLTVTKGNFDMSGVTLTSKGYVYDGNPHAAQYSGTLPSEEITVSYRYVNTADGSESTEAPVEIGLYLVYASFTHSNSNYNDISEKVAYIRIAATAEEANQPFPQLPSDEELAAAADLAKKKTEAKKTLDEEAKKKKDEIDSDPNLSAEDKKAAKDAIDEELKKGNAAIDKATDKDGVDKAYDDGKKEIEDSAELSKKKGAAKSELDKAAQAKKEAIDNNPDLTDEEKAAAKAEVDKELEEGKKAIDNATSVSGVESTESTTKSNIENINPQHKGSFPWWILAVIAGALLLLILLIIVIVKRRNSDDEDGYDDFYDDEYDYDEEEEIDDGGDEAYGY